MRNTDENDHQKIVTRGQTTSELRKRHEEP